MTLKELNAELREWTAVRYAAVPLHALPKNIYKENTANGLATTIKAFCEMKGIMCQRTGNEGRYRPGQSVVDVIGRTRLMKGTWLPGQNNGQGDLHITLKGMSHWIEIKIGRDTQSDKQKEFEAMVRRSGATYDIVKTWEDFFKVFSKWKK
jgi:hypothetical protein